MLWFAVLVAVGSFAAGLLTETCYVDAPVFGACRRDLRSWLITAAWWIGGGSLSYLIYCVAEFLGAWTVKSSEGDADDSSHQSSAAAGESDRGTT